MVKKMHGMVLRKRHRIVTRKSGCAGRDVARYYTAKGIPTCGFVDLVQTFPVVCGDVDLARKICKECEIKSFDMGSVISSQDSNDEGAYFIVSGEVDVRVNDSSVARRRSKELIGELSVMCCGARRCASLVALTQVEALYLKCDDLVRLTEEHPKMLKRMFNVLADRLRERNVAFRVPNAPPKIFVGSSTKGKNFAHMFVDKVKELVEEESGSGVGEHTSLDSDGAKVVNVETVEINYWDKAVFSPSGTTLDTLIDQSKKVDFAIFALTKDDLSVDKHKTDRWLPRDNVIFEIGLFMGELSKDRTYLVIDQNDFKKLKLPSDLHGFTVAVFDKKRHESIKDKAREIAKMIRTHRSISGMVKR